MMRERFRIAAPLARLLDEDAEQSSAVDHALDRHAKLHVGPLLIDLLKTVRSTFAPSASTGRTHGVLMFTRPALLVPPLPLVVQFRFFRMCTKPHARPFARGVVLLGVLSALLQPFRVHRFAARVDLPARAAVHAEAVRLRGVSVELLRGLRLAALRTAFRRVVEGPGLTAAGLAARGQTVGLAAILRELSLGFRLRALGTSLHSVTIT